MQESDVIDRIKAICEARSWTFYRLAKESGITYSTLCTMLHKSTSPSMSTLIKICNGFGISLAEFFDGNNSHAVLSDAQKEHLKLWNSLSAENQMVATNYIRFLLSEQDVKK
jgi:transcriptional regulator with XRE-family HTH domain